MTEHVCIYYFSLGYKLVMVTKSSLYMKLIQGFRLVIVHCFNMSWMMQENYSMYVNPVFLILPFYSIFCNLSITISHQTRLEGISANKAMQFAVVLEVTLLIFSLLFFIKRPDCFELSFRL